MKNLFPCLLASFFAAGLPADSRSAPPASRPNILFIFSDDHALNAISAYGGPLKDIAPTPNIDRLAAQGVLFTRSYCGNSICGPSRATVLTGLHSHLNGFRVNGDRFFGRQTTFPALLQKAGYQTALIGKWHLESNPVGFDHWQILPGQGMYYNPQFLSAGGVRKRLDGYCTDLITDLSLEWLKRRDPAKPFLLMAQHKAPHRNWMPPERHLDLFKGVEFPEPSTLFDDHSGRSPLLQNATMRIARDFHWAHDMKFQGPNLFPEHFTGGGNEREFQNMSPAQKAAWDACYEPRNQELISALRSGKMSKDDLTRWKYQRYLRDYLSSVRAVDDGVGRLLDYLQEAGLAENTLVVYSSDQGFYLGEHGWYDKRWAFEESLSMPFIARLPGVTPAGARCDAMIQNIDYAPTFLEAAGVAVPASMQGRSLLPLLAKPSAPPADWREAILYTYYETGMPHHVPVHEAARDARHKLLFFPATGEYNLFDLQKDPRELRSVHADPEYAGVLAGMKARLATLKKENLHFKSAQAEPRMAEGWWKKRHEERLGELKGGEHALVFIGDSITQGWEGRGKEHWNRLFAPAGAVNLGYSGDRTEQVLWRLLNGEMPGKSPRAFVVMIGTNNTGHRMDPADETAAGIRRIVTLLREVHPASDVVLCAVFPRGAEPGDKMRVRNNEINTLIRPLAEGPKIHWLDMAPAFLAADGTLPAEIMPDRLHLSPAGYKLWAEALQEKIKAIP